MFFKMQEKYADEEKKSLMGYKRQKNNGCCG
jgi:hypothetical protein